MATSVTQHRSVRASGTAGTQTSLIQSQIKFLLHIRPYTTLSQVRRLMPHGEAYGNPLWVQSINDWGNFVSLKGPISGSLVFLDSAKPYHGMKEMFSRRDPLNYVVVSLPTSSADAEAVLNAYVRAIDRNVGQRNMVQRDGSYVHYIEWHLRGGRILSLQEDYQALRLSFSYTIGGEPGDQQ